MIGGGMFNQPIMGNRVFIVIETVAKFCLTGIAKLKYSLTGAASENSPLTGVVKDKVNLTAVIKQRCDSDC